MSPVNYTIENLQRYPDYVKDAIKKYSKFLNSLGLDHKALINDLQNGVKTVVKEFNKGKYDIAEAAVGISNEICHVQSDIMRLCRLDLTQNENDQLAELVEDINTELENLNTIAHHYRKYRR